VRFLVGFCVAVGAFVAFIGFIFLGYTHQGSEPENADTVGAALLGAGLFLVAASLAQWLRERHR
jgi:hypothetical protein